MVRNKFREVSSICGLPAQLAAMTLSAAIASEACAESYGRIESGLEYRRFLHDQSGTDTYRDSYALRGEAEWGKDVDDLSLKGRIFANLDSQDSGRRYMDIREAYLAYDLGAWQLSGGIGTFYWGVSETVSVVNDLNQSDIREQLDQKTKMGQPFVSAKRNFPSGSVTLFYLPVFIEREFPDRPYPGAQVESDAIFESHNPDRAVAMRTELFLDNSEIGLGFMSGTRRDPILLARSATDGPILQPFYPSTKNFTVDGVTFLGDLALKGELKLGRELDERFTAVNVGFEYPLATGTDWIRRTDLIAEYVRDDREELAGSLGQRDLFAGLRAALGSLAQAELRWVLGYDLEHHSRFMDLQLTYRLSDHVQARLQSVSFSNVARADPHLFPVRNEDYVALEIRYSL